MFSAKMFPRNRPLIILSGVDGWIFKPGNDSSWANVQANTSDWRILKPTELTAKDADKTGKVEGWFRLKLKLDKDFGNIQFGLNRGGWAATDIYVDGNFVESFGNTGTRGQRFKEYNPIDKTSVPLNLETGKEHLLAIHFVDYLSSLPVYQLRSGTSGGVRWETMKGLQYFISLDGQPNADLMTLKHSRRTLFFRSIWLSVTLLLALLFWLLTILNPKERAILSLISIYSSFSALSNLSRFFLADQDISFVAFRINDLLQKFSYWMVLITSFFIVTTILNFKLPRNFKRLLLTYFFIGALTVFFNFYKVFSYINFVIGFLGIMYILASSLKKLKGAQWAIVGGVMLSVLFASIYAITDLLHIFRGGLPGLILLTCSYFLFSLSLVVYISLRFREIMRDVRENARQVVRLSEEKREQALNQQVILEQQVKERTAELSQSLDNLRTTQSQLIQSEKMASLGELTAGIAHEIQNPLNFVNNFSEVNKELLLELSEEARKGNMEEVMIIADNVIGNEEKINQHGKRADAIVKGMLQHTRTSSGQKERTDINALCDEYLRLAYHGLRAKDKNFNANRNTDFDASIGKINIVPQDIGRVILNVINNSFYAVGERQKAEGLGYEPLVIISTKKLNDKVEIKIKDNGNGIPQKILDKIFQPFFTTKPTGQGTGLGLSLAYDIVKGHGGEIKVETEEGEGSLFTITLPLI